MNIVKNQDGFTIVELAIIVFGLAWMSFCGWLVYLVIKALLKYIGS